MNQYLYCVKMIDRSENPDAAPELLAACGYASSAWEDREGGANRLTVYFTDEAEARAAFAELLELVPEWREYGIELGDLEYFELKKEDWSEAWKRYFHVIEVAPNLAIRPSWIEFQPRPGQRVVDIDPGMSFGTGQHATTLYCLEILARLAGTPGLERVLDAGCGSGILAIAAGVLGYPVIDAFDNDPEAVRIAAENIEFNHLAGKIVPFTGDATVFEAPLPGYDVACVNILGHILKANARRIAGWVRPGGRLVLAGILNEEFDDLSRAFAAAGAREIERKTLREWTSGLFAV